MRDEDEDQGRERARLVCFFLHGQEFALPIESVRETLRLRPITRVILTPPWLVGVFSLRGEIVPAIDIASWLGMPSVTLGDESRLVVVRHATRPFGVLVDKLAELRTVGTSELSPPPPTLSPAQAALVASVAATETGTVRIIDPDAILGSDAIRSLMTNDTRGAA